MCQVSLPAPQQPQGQMCRNGGGTPRSAPTPIKNALFTKRIYHSKSGPDSSIFARSLLLTPNERRDQMCQVFGLARGPRSPKTWHICSFPPCTTATARPHVPEWGEPRDRPRPQSKTHFLRKEFITQNLALIFQFLPAPSSFLLLPTPNERKDQMCQVFGLARARGAPKPGTFAPSLPAPQQRQGQMCRNGGEHRDRPRPQSKTHFLRKEDFTQNLALIFQFLPAPSLLPPPPYTQ